MIDTGTMQHEHRPTSAVLPVSDGHVSDMESGHSATYQAELRQGATRKAVPDHDLRGAIVDDGTRADSPYARSACRALQLLEVSCKVWLLTGVARPGIGCLRVIALPRDGLFC